jgi:hypothetical protein
MKTQDNPYQKAISILYKSVTSVRMRWSNRVRQSNNRTSLEFKISNFNPKKSKAAFSSFVDLLTSVKVYSYLKT